MKYIQCPYCGTEQEINHDDGYGYEEDKAHNQECNNCGKTFVYYTSISFYYEANKADCLNDAEHKFEKTHTYPEEFSKMRCSDCGEERELTEDERKHYMLKSKEEYFESLKLEK